MNDGFNPNPNGIVNTVAVQPDGKVLLGGYFTQINPEANPGSSAGYIARINHDGSVDTSFKPSADAVVRSIVLQPTGQILVAGEFTHITPTGSSTASPRGYVARLNADGTLDAAFNPNANAVVYAVAYQANGQIIIGGSFTTVQPAGASAPVTRNHIARFNADGSLDTSFDPNTDKPVLALAVEANGQILVGGGFSQLAPNGAATETTRNCIARLNSDGSLDTTFDPEAGGSVMSIVPLPNGQILLGGQFVSFQPNGASAATQCDFLGRLNADGTLDTSFIVNPLSYVSAVAVQGDGSVLIGGIFTSIFAANSDAATSIAYAARINSDGSVDTTFFPNVNQAVNAIAVQSDGEIILGGFFTSAGTVPRNFLARVGQDGSLDGSLAPDNEGTIITSVTLSNGQRLVGGSFFSMGGLTQSYLARINADGTLDTAFRPIINGSVLSIVVQTNGEYVISGTFTQVDGIVRAYIARVNPDGTLDGPYNPNPNGNVNYLYLQADGKIIASGAFSVLTPNGATTGTGINNLVRLNTDGTVDTTFVPNPEGSVYSIVAQSDGMLVIGGEFTSVDGLARGYIARIDDITGKLDTTFDPECNEAVYAIAIQSDGKIVIGGAFTAIAPQVAGKLSTNTSTINQYGTTQTLPQPGYSATTPIYINHMARLNTDGTLDTTFFPDPSSNVTSLAIQADGGIVVGGIFTSFGPGGNPVGTIRNYLGRVNSDGSLDANFNPNANAFVNTVQYLTGGDILVAGAFTALQPPGASAPIPAVHMAILNADGSSNTSFKGSATGAAVGSVNATALQPNGAILLGGSFGPMGGAPGSYMASISANGAPNNFNAYLDGAVNAISVLPTGAATATNSSYAVWLEAAGTVRHNFAASSNGEVLCVAQQANGQVLVGGTFSTFNNSTTSQYIVRLNTDGTIDTTFAPPLNGQVNAIVVQANGDIVVGGSFTNIVGANAVSYMARLLPDGTVDSSYQPAPNLDVTCLALQANGQIVAGGNFTAVETSTTTGTVARNYLARFNTDGSLDTTFNPDPNGTPAALLINSSGQIYVGGNFSTVDPGLSTVYTYGSLVELNSDGSLVKTFNPGPTSTVDALAFQANGDLLVGGAFPSFLPGEGTATSTTSVTPVNIGSLARLNTDGSVDTTFNPTPNGEVTSIVVLANQQIVVGGAFTSLQPNSAPYPTSRLFIARINPDASVDPSFDTELNNAVNVVYLLSDGSLFVGGAFTGVNVGGATLIGGTFSHVGGFSASNLARLNADSTDDSTFTANTDGPVYALTPQANGATLVGGSFSHMGTTARSNIGRLNLNGNLDTTFAPTANATVDAISTQINGSIVIGGSFTQVNGQAATYVARLTSSGTTDASFAATVNGTVDAIVIQQNGQIVIGGSFTSVDGQAVGDIARLNSNGTLDTTFNPNANGTVSAVSLQTDGSFVVGGSFTTIGGLNIPYAAHVESDGTIDSTFAPTPNAPVATILVQQDGKVLLGGSFTSVGGLSRYEIARVSVQTAVQQTLTSNASESTFTWTRTGPAPSFASVLFDESTDGTNWVTIGQGVPISPSTWQVSGAPGTGSNAFYLRATGVTLGSEYSSSGLIQAIQAINVTAIPAITSAGQATGSSGTVFNFKVAATQMPTYFSASGLPPGLTINSSSGVISGTPTGSGTYTVTITAGNASGSSTSTLTITIGAIGGTNYTPAPGSATGRLLNLSCRADLPGSKRLILGFVVAGTGQKSVVLRAVGPGLAQFDLTGLMATPEIQLYDNSGNLVMQNAGWGGSASIASAMASVGAFSLSANSEDSVIVTSLPAGPYTIQVFDPAGVGGVCLTEVYDASTTPLADTARLSNLSAQGAVGTGSNTLIGGFVIDGSSTKSVVIRGVGPGLAGFSVAGYLADPVLSVYDNSGNLVAQNSSWSNQVIAGPYQAAVGPSNIINLDILVGGFSLSPADTALVADLPPGAYTFQITSASGATGQALGEVYELP